MSNSKWRRVKDILEYKKKGFLSLGNINNCKIPGSHTVEEINYTFHWKGSYLGISMLLTTYLVMDMILCPFGLCPVTTELEIKCLGNSHSKFQQLGTS